MVSIFHRTLELNQCYNHPFENTIEKRNRWGCYAKSKYQAQRCRMFWYSLLAFSNSSGNTMPEKCVWMLLPPNWALNEGAYMILWIFWKAFISSVERARTCTIGTGSPRYRQPSPPWRYPDLATGSVCWHTQIRNVIETAPWKVKLCMSFQHWDVSEIELWWMELNCTELYCGFRSRTEEREIALTSESDVCRSISTESTFLQFALQT